MGPPGLKGSTGIKGSKGNRVFNGIQGPKGECIVTLRISVSPESQYVFLNKPETFCCWVQGHLSKKITWRKLGSSFSYDSTADGVLHIKNVQRSHIGSYLCTVFTNYGVFRALAILGIKGEPFYCNFFVCLFCHPYKYDRFSTLSTICFLCTFLFNLVIAFLKLAVFNEIKICKIFSFGHSSSEVFRFYVL